MMRRFCQYVEKCFGFSRVLGTLSDSREKPQISTQAVFASVFAMFATREASLNAMESQLRVPKRLEALVGKRKPSADTVGRVMEGIHSGPLRQMLRANNLKLRRNKALENNPWAMRFAAVDGHEFFSSRHRSCPDCCKRTVEVKKKKVTEYYHRGVACHLIGFDLALPLDIEMIRPGEGEVVAARRLLERVFRDYSRFFDAVVADSLYLEAPFFDFCADHGKYALAVLKENNPALLADAKGVFGAEAPQRAKDGKRSFEYWDAEGFKHSSIGAPLRVLHTLETENKRERIAGEWVKKTEVHNWWWATDIPASILPPRQLWQAGHKRWAIENQLFNTLVTHFSLNHCFRHHPTAILNFILTLFIAFALLQSFYRGNLKAPLRTRFTLIGIAGQIRLGLAELGRWRAPWHQQVANAPP